MDLGLGIVGERREEYFKLRKHVLWPHGGKGNSDFKKRRDQRGLSVMSKRKFIRK